MAARGGPAGDRESRRRDGHLDQTDAEREADLAMRAFPGQPGEREQLRDGVVPAALHEPVERWTGTDLSHVRLDTHVRPVSGRGAGWRHRRHVGRHGVHGRGGSRPGRHPLRPPSPPARARPCGSVRELPAGPGGPPRSRAPRTRVLRGRRDVEGRLRAPADGQTIVARRGILPPRRVRSPGRNRT